MLAVIARGHSTLSIRARAAAISNLENRDCFAALAMTCDRQGVVGGLFQMQKVVGFFAGAQDDEVLGC